MRRTVVVAVVTGALVAGAASAWAWDGRAAAASRASHDRVAQALAAGADDEQAAAELSVRSIGVVGQGLMLGTHADLAELIPEAQAALEASAGQVPDDAVRQRLADAIAAAQEALAGSAAPARANALASDMVAASAAVAAAQQEWLAAQAAAAAAEQTPEPTAAGRTPTRAEAAPVCSGPPAREPFYTSIPTAEGDGSNGNVPRSAMKATSLTDRHGNVIWLAAAAADSFERLNAAFRTEFGQDIAADMAYRDYCTQVAMREFYGAGHAAVPGESNHGWGTALDVYEYRVRTGPNPDPDYRYGSPMHTWLAVNGPAYGWYEQPQPGEYWHFDYRG